MEQMILRSARAGNAQSGVALIMVLIMLAAMAIAGIALVRVVDSANVIAGNFAFRQATLNIADLGTEAAIAELRVIQSMNTLDKPYPDKCTTKCRYYPAMSMDEAMLRTAQGLPKWGSINGTKTEVIDWNANDWPDLAELAKRDEYKKFPEFADFRTLQSQYEIRYVIDRQCTVAPVTDAVGQCLTETPQSGASRKSGATVFTPASSIYYRVSVQVTGPRNTQSHVQVMLVY